MLADIQRQGIDLIDAIKIVRLTDDASLWEAHHAVTAHPAWQAALPQTRHFTVGIPTTTPLAAIAAAVSAALGVLFRERDSAYYGGQYFLAGAAGVEEIRIYRNYDPQDRSPIYEDATDCPALIEFSRTPRDPTGSAQILSAALGVACRVVRPRGPTPGA